MSNASVFTRRAEELVPGAPQVTAGGIQVHPLVVMNISDHWTRALTTSQASADVYGALLGQVVGGRLEVITSFELRLDRHCESHVSIVGAREHVDRLVEVFPGLYVVGWYTCGDKLDSSKHPAVHSQLCDMFTTENLLVLLMDPAPSHRKVLPLYAFERRSSFYPVEFCIVADEMETIGVNAAVQAESQDADTRSRTVTQTAQRAMDALHILQDCLRTITGYLRAVESGENAGDSELMRTIATLCHRLSAGSPDSNQDKTYALLIVYMSVLSKSLGSVSALGARSLVGNDAGRGRFRDRREHSGTHESGALRGRK